MRCSVERRNIFHGSMNQKLGFWSGSSECNWWVPEKSTKLCNCLLPRGILSVFRRSHQTFSFVINDSKREPRSDCRPAKSSIVLATYCGVATIFLLPLPRSLELFYSYWGNLPNLNSNIRHATVNVWNKMIIYIFLKNVYCVIH